MPFFVSCNHEYNIVCSVIIATGAATGSNSVISMLHCWLQINQDRWPIKLHIHADNCSGQNKNNALIAYLTWAIDVNMLSTWELSFMLPGHTKFSPDAYFGMFKSKYYVADQCDDVHDLMSIANSCTTGGNVTPVHFGEAPYAETWVWRDWWSLQCYGRVKNLKSNYHFRMRSQHMLEVLP